MKSNQKQKQKQNIFLICIGMVLLFIIGLSFEKLLLEAKPNGLQTSIVPEDNPSVQYNVTQAKQLHELFHNRPALSTSDQAAKQKLTAQKNPLHTTDTFSIEYLSAPDEFMVEILTPDFDKAKADTVAWLNSQGISDDGICKLPVVFYLNYEVANSLRNANIDFKPLPPGC